MPTKIKHIFDRNRYLHRSEPFTIISEWFRNAQLSQFTSIREYVINCTGLKKAMPIDSDDNFHIELNSVEIPYLLFLESQAFLNRALSNFCAQLTLHRSGFSSWATITTYYSSFFAMSGLIRLQGKARISTHDLNKLPRGFFLCMSSTTQPRCILFNHWRNYHKQTCLDFGLAYRNFDLFRYSFQDLLSLRNDELIEEVRRRNAYNYILETGFREIASADHSRPDLARIGVNKVRSLPSLVTGDDPDLAYMARACSRIILLAATSWHIAKHCNILRQVFDRFLQDRVQLINNLSGINCAVGKCLLCFTRGRMKLN